MYNLRTIRKFGIKVAKMRFEELNWFDIENYLKTDDRLMVVLGA